MSMNNMSNQTSKQINQSPTRTPSTDLNSSTASGTRAPSTDTNSLLKDKEDEISILDIEKDISISSGKIAQMSIDSSLSNAGNLYLFLYKDGNPRICIGPHWPFTLCLASFITSMCMLYFYGLWNIMNEYVRVIGLMLFFIQMSSYMYTALVNPGLPKSEAWMVNISTFAGGEYRMCKTCHVITKVEAGARHCEECNVCIEGHDHHCPWTSKCVGKGNIIPFYIFVSFTCVLIGFLIFGLFTIAALNSK